MGAAPAARDCELPARVRQLLLLQYALVAFLIGVLAVAVVSFARLGVAKLLRTRRLGRSAHQKGMRFFRDDPYDAARRYAQFAVISSGHSPRANNVTDGRLAGEPVRAFDFRCELAHGTRRTTRYYNVLVAETRHGYGSVVMWNEADADLAPLAARDSAGRLGAWDYRGSRRLAAALAAACKDLADVGASMEIRGSILMVSVPVTRFGSDYVVGFGQLAQALAAVRGAASADAQPAPAT